MRKVFLGICLVTTLLVSCSKEEVVVGSGVNPESLIDTSVLIRKIVDNSTGVEVTSNFEYSGNKLLKVTESTGKVISYNYTKNLITSSQVIKDNQVVQKDNFVYNTSGQLVNSVRLNYNGDNSTGVRYEYFYSTDVISFSGFEGDLTSQTNLFEKGKMFLKDNEIVRVESYSIDSGALIRSVDYVYDNKSNPLKNVLGYDKTSYNGGKPRGISRNIISRSSSSMVSSFNFVYDAKGYPTMETRSSSITKYFY